MPRKPPNKYQYEIGQSVKINCISEKECMKLFWRALKDTSERFAAVKGFGNTGKHLVDNRTSGKEGVIIDRTDGSYIVSYKTGAGRDREVMCLCAANEIESVNPFDDAVVRWLGESREQL